MPIDHVKLPVSDLDASRAFYCAALAPIGYVLVHDGESSLGFVRGDGGEEDEPFAVERTVAPSVSTHVAFTSSGRDQVDAFYAAAIAAGGSDNGPPGLCARPESASADSGRAKIPGERPYGGFYYAAFVRDPDGHNVEAVYHGPASRREPAAPD